MVVGGGDGGQYSLNVNWFIIANTLYNNSTLEMNNQAMHVTFIRTIYTLECVLVNDRRIFFEQ